MGGSKITIIGKPGSGKSVLIKAILNAKKHLIPVGTVISGTEDTNKFYSRMFPVLFIYEKFKLSIVEAVQRRQKIAKDNLPNSWAVLVMDDCMDDVKVFNDPIMVGLMKNSRHWNLLSIFSNQYVFDFKPVIRSNIDGVFIFREPNQSNREKIYKNFASIIPTYKLFCQIMDAITGENTCIYIDNQTTSNDWKECVYYYKAPLVSEFSFGCDEYWQFSDDRQKN
jgi:ABC-type dipeptide/oligopeptide/nickel transport system ATPase component